MAKTCRKMQDYYVSFFPTVRLLCIAPVQKIEAQEILPRMSVRKLLCRIAKKFRKFQQWRPSAEVSALCTGRYFSLYFVTIGVETIFHGNVPGGLSEVLL